MCLLWLISDMLLNGHWDTHGKTYKMKCAEEEINMHPGDEPPPEDTNGKPKLAQLTSFMRPK